MIRHAFVYALLFLCASILLPEPGRAQNPPTASANLLEWSTPAAAGLDPDHIATIHAALQERVERGEVAGAVVLLARRGKVVYLDSVGYTDLSLQQPMPSDALFRIGSMTKPVTSVAVMILHDEGRISLSDPLSKYLPEFGNPKVLVVSPTDSVASVVAARREISIATCSVIGPVWRTALSTMVP